MKEIRLTVSDVWGHVDARYWPELETEVGRLQTCFTQIERSGLRGVPTCGRFRARSAPGPRGAVERFQ